MIEINFDNLGPRLTKDDILSKVSEEAIYKYFCKDFPKRVFPSPFRKDKHASFGFFKRGNSWLWKDIAMGDSGNVFQFVMKHQNLDFQGALKLIADIFYITAEGKNNIVINSKFSTRQADEAEEKGRSLIQVIRKPLTKDDLKWWNDRLLNPNLLEYYCIRAAKEVWCDKRLVWYDKPNNPIYYWLYPYSNNVKCYRPLEENRQWKWLSNADDLKDIQGYHQCKIKLMPGRPLILTKSMKECGFFRAFHVNAMASNAEGYILNADFIRHIKKYCYPIISLYDNDEAGIKGATRLEETYGIPPVFVNKDWGAKDPTDLWMKDYKRFYHFLNLIDEYVTSIERYGYLALPPRELRITDSS